MIKKYGQIYSIFLMFFFISCGHQGIYKIVDTKDYKFNISCPSEKTKDYFNQAMIFIHGYNYPEAERFFQLAIFEDSSCALCYWGVAFSRHKMALETGEDYSKLGYNNFLNAKSIAKTRNVTQLESDLIESIKPLFIKDKHLNNSQRYQGYLNNMLQLADKYPQNAEVKALAVDAIYYSGLGIKNSKLNLAIKKAASKKHHANICTGLSKDYRAKSLSLLEEGLKINPRHPGLHHYYIHLIELETKQSEIMKAYKSSIFLEKNYGDSSTHFSHMPAHIFYRVGDYDRAIKANEINIQNDRKYFLSGGLGITNYYFDYHYLHAFHFLQLMGILTENEKLALENSKILYETTDIHRNSTLVNYNDSLLANYALNLAYFQRAKEVLALPRPIMLGTLGHILFNLAQGYAAIQLGENKIYQNIIHEFKNKLKNEYKKDKKFVNFAQMSLIFLQGEKSFYEKNYKKAISLFIKLKQKENEISFTNPPPWQYFSDLFLGKSYLEDRQRDKAKECFQNLLDRFPNFKTAEKYLKEIEK